MSTPHEFIHIDNKGIGQKSLKETYCLAFSKVTRELIRHYGSKTGGKITLFIEDSNFKVMRDGKLFETVSMDNLDAIFEKVPVQNLRKQLKKL